MSKYFCILLITLFCSSVAAQNIPIDNSTTKYKVSIDNTYTKSKYKKGFYNWSVFVKADEKTLNTIDHVEYLLHPTFREPLVSSDNREKNFKYDAVAWGEFEIRATIYFKKKTERPITLIHWLKLSPTARKK